MTPPSPPERRFPTCHYLAGCYVAVAILSALRNRLPDPRCAVRRCYELPEARHGNLDIAFQFLRRMRLIDEQERLTTRPMPPIAAEFF